MTDTKKPRRKLTPPENRSYKLHYKCRKLGLKLNSRNREFSDNINNYAAGKNRWQLELMNNYGYTIQFNF
ncbi:MAG: hypothetical protein LBN95_01595 [Prevotellaceae bacterium]|jgi:hypothetical protein|nr:hypothetical protein [Prevotellaceae bacterium]